MLAPSIPASFASTDRESENRSNGNPSRFSEVRNRSKQLALEVAEALSRKDALDAHARDELGITETSKANPLQAAMASALSFTVGGLPPLLAVWILPATVAIWAIAAVAIVTLALLEPVLNLMRNERYA
jgi:VIT1/CCC1 family predicted Fe2+/Mn2+ transporter